MRVRNAVMALSGLALVAAGCSSGPPVDPGTTTTKDLKILSLNPTTVYIEGTDNVTMKTENGCGKDKMTLTVDSLPVTQIQQTDLNTYVFTAPPKAVTSKTQVPVAIKCSAPPDATFKYGADNATSALTYDPDAEPQPSIKTPSPIGGTINSNGISVLAQMVVVFTRPMNPATITKDTFGISSVTGTIDASDPAKTTFKFKPDQQLQYGTTYTCVVKGGTDGVKSAAAGKTLKPTQAPNNGSIDPNQDSWTFTTRCEGCGNPWLGDISAAAGISSGGSYKLFSVTGQPTPVGEATNDQYKLQSGFIYATAPGQQQ